MKNFTINNESEWENFAVEINPFLSKNIVLLKGDLGTGKTTFVKAFMKLFGSQNQVSSPTYALINEYLLSNGKTIYHMDLYRLNSLDEALNIGIEEYLHSQNLCFIEWPELILPLLEDEFHLMHITTPDKNTRHINFT